MFHNLKRALKLRLQDHVRREVMQASRDIDLARFHAATVDSAIFVDRHMPQVRSFPDRFALLRTSIENIRVAGLCCEFGVYRGETVNFIASLLPGEVHGFDSFDGLPDDWNDRHPRGTFAMPELPKVRANVRLHRGWFETSLPPFLEEYSGPAALLHIDADLYSSTRTVLHLMADRIVAGTVLQFDEFLNYPGWQGGEYKAFQEFCLAHEVEFRYLGYVGLHGQVAVKILQKRA
jgi:hypothetical protein